MQDVRGGLWQRSIGKLIFSFGYIEMYLNQLLGSWLDEEVFAHIESDPLGKRLRLTAALAPSHSRDDAFTSELAKLLQTIEQLSLTRNMVAHNPVLIRSQRLSTGEWNMKHIIRHPKRKQQVPTLEDVQKAAASAATAANDLARLLCDAVQQIMEGRHGKAGAPRIETIARLFNAEVEGVETRRPSR